MQAEEFVKGVKKENTPRLIWHNNNSAKVNPQVCSMQPIPPKNTR